MTFVMISQSLCEITNDSNKYSFQHNELVPFMTMVVLAKNSESITGLLSLTDSDHNRLTVSVDNVNVTMLINNQKCYEISRSNMSVFEQYFGVQNI